MRRVVLALAVGLVAGIGATLAVRALTATPPADPRGLGVVCDRDLEGDARGARCWQGGEQVEPPAFGPCAGQAREFIQWGTLSDVPGYFVYGCSGDGQRAP